MGAEERQTWRRQFRRGRIERPETNWQFRVGRLTLSLGGVRGCQPGQPGTRGRNGASMCRSRRSPPGEAVRAQR